MPDRTKLAAIAALIFLLGSTALAGAAEAPTREEYVARLETICKPRSEATERVMRGAKGDVQAERLKVAAGKFAKATAIFGGTVQKLRAVAPPSADAAKLSQWLTELGQQEGYLRRITAQLRAERPIPAQRLTARFIHSGNQANNTVLAFGFDYCSFKFSRYG